MTNEAKAEAGLGGALEFMRILWELDHHLNSASKRMSGRLGVTGPQRLVLRIVGRFPNISAGRLAEILHVHPSTLTGVLKRLEARNLIARRADRTDARRALLSLTAKGKTLDQVRSGTVEHAVRTVLARVPRAQVDATQSLLAELARELEVRRAQ